MGEKAKRVLNFAEFQDNFDDDKGETAGNTQQDVDMFANKADDFAKATMDDYSKMINIAGTQQGPEGEEEEAPEININIEAPDDEGAEAEDREEGEDTEVKAPEAPEEEEDPDDVPSYEEYAKKDKGEEEADEEGEEEEEKPKTEEPSEGEEDDDDEKGNDVDLSELDDEKYSEQ